MYHRQFAWQNPAHISHIYRYYKIFLNGELSELLKVSTGLTTFEIIQSGFTISSMFLKDFKHPLPIISKIAAISNIQIQTFLDSFAIHLYDLQNKISATNAYDENLYYKYNSLRESPLIIIENELYCPFPSMLFWHFTSSLYYRICNSPGFSRPFGAAFQEYVGFIIKKVVNPVNFKLIPEAKYKVGKSIKDSIDWILEDDSGYLFIECKTKRLILSAKIQLLDDIDLNLELDKMADFIFQSYKTIFDCQNGHYTNIKYNSSKPAFVIVMTLEDWYLNFHPSYFFDLEPLVKTKLINAGIDIKIIEKVPYFIESIKGFERNVQLLNHLNIYTYFTKL